MRTFFLLAAAFAVLCGVQIASADFGANWTATYYNSTDLSGAVAYTEVLPSGININWGNGSPNAAVNTDNFSARFTSTQLFGDGLYEFIASSYDGVRVYIDNALVLDRFIQRALTTDRVQHTMTAGQHTLTVEIAEFIGDAAVQFQWFLVGSPELALFPVSGIADGRVNNQDLAAPVAAYCESGGLKIYAITPQGEGELAFIVTPEQFREVADDPEGVLIAAGEGIGGAIELWHTAEGRVLLRAHNSPPENEKIYDFVWGGCGY